MKAGVSEINSKFLLPILRAQLSIWQEILVFFPGGHTHTLGEFEILQFELTHKSLYTLHTNFATLTSYSLYSRIQVNTMGLA